MPNLKDATVLVVGQVIDTQVITKRGTGEFEGRKVTIMSAGDGDPGFAVVKISADDSNLYNPNHFDQVAWWVRSSPYDIADGGSRNTGMSTRFVKAATEADLQGIHVVITAKASK